MKIAAMILFVIGTAGVLPAPVSMVPEVDPGSAGTAIALLSGALLLIRSRRKK
jgi:hypothetical protein